MWDRSARIGTDCALRVVSTSVARGRVAVKVAGLRAGRLTVSGRGVQRTARRLAGASVATIRPQLSRAGRRAVRAGRAVRLTVSFDPAGEAKARRLQAAARRGDQDR